jgi:hypothetical protein
MPRAPLVPRAIVPDRSPAKRLGCTHVEPKYDRALATDDCGLKRLAQPATVSSYPHLGEPKADSGTAVTGDDATAVDIIATGDDGYVADQPCRNIGEVYLICHAATATSIFQPGAPILEPPLHVSMCIASRKHVLQHFVIAACPCFTECSDRCLKILQIRFLRHRSATLWGDVGAKFIEERLSRNVNPVKSEPFPHRHVGGT